MSKKLLVSLGLTLLISGGMLYASAVRYKDSETAAVNRILSTWENCNGGEGPFPEVHVDMLEKKFVFYCATPTPTPIPDYEEIVQETKEHLADLKDAQKWRCRMVVDCQHVDWRYYDPEDVCTYEMTTITYPTNPELEPKKFDIGVSYGGWCEKL